MSNYFSLWVGDNISHVELGVAVKNTQVLGSENYQVFLYPEFSKKSQFDLFESVGVRVSDANAVIPYENVFKNPDRQSFAGFSNIFRYKGLLDLSRSGPAIWLDLDYVVQAPPVWSDVLLGFQSRRWVNGAIFGISGKVGRELATSLLESATVVRPESVTWGSLGPRLITTVLHQRFQPLVQQVKSPSLLYPIAHHRAADFWDPSELVSTRSRIHVAAGYHLWNERMRAEVQGPRLAKPIPGSFMAEFFDELHGSGFPKHHVPATPLTSDAVDGIRYQTRRSPYRIAKALFQEWRSGILPPRHK